MANDQPPMRRNNKSYEGEHPPPEKTPWWQPATTLLLLVLAAAIWTEGLVTRIWWLLALAVVTTLLFVGLIIVIWRLASIRRASFRHENSAIDFEAHETEAKFGGVQRSGRREEFRTDSKNSKSSKKKPLQSRKGKRRKR